MGKLSQFKLAAQLHAAPVFMDVVIEDEFGDFDLPEAEPEKSQEEKHTTMRNQKHPEIMIGQQFGELTVKEELAERDKAGQRRYRCLCSCGESKVAIRYLLISGQTKSCGHLRKSKGNGKVAKPASPKRERVIRSHALPKASGKINRVEEQTKAKPEPQDKEPQAPAVAEQPVQSIAPRTAQAFDLKAAALQIEGITQLARAIPLASIAAVRDELRRLKGQPYSPLFDDSKKLDEYLAVTNEFYEYRSALQVLEDL